jgi:rRNA maturation protein Nop10
LKWQIRRCNKCKEYTLNYICPRCKTETETSIPPKFSLHDKYARYRIEELKIHEEKNNEKQHEDKQKQP